MAGLALYLTAVVCACGLLPTLAQDTTSFGSEIVFTSAGTIYNRTGSLQPVSTQRHTAEPLQSSVCPGSGG